MLSSFVWRINKYLTPRKFKLILLFAYVSGTYPWGERGRFSFYLPVMFSSLLVFTSFSLLFTCVHYFLFLLPSSLPHFHFFITICICYLNNEKENQPSCLWCWPWDLRNRSAGKAHARVEQDSSGALPVYFLFTFSLCLTFLFLVFCFAHVINRCVSCSNPFSN